MVFGNGSQKRSFIFVEDAVEGLIRSGLGSVSGPLDIASATVVSIRSLAEKILEYTKADSKLSFEPQTHLDVTEPIINIQKSHSQ